MDGSSADFFGDSVKRSGLCGIISAWRPTLWRNLAADRVFLVDRPVLLRVYAAVPMSRLASICLALCLPAAQAVEKPNIIVIMADDIGYGDLGCYGAKTIPTPNIDRLAAGGQRFTSGYCSASTCTPTRFSLLTGTYAFRQERTGIAPPNAPAIIKPGTETLASLLQKAGYRSAVIGKWHLGLGDPAPDWNGALKPGPLEIGFDHCFLLPTTNDRVPQVFVEDHRVPNLDPADPLWVGDRPPQGDHPTGVSHRQTLKMDWSHGHNQTIHNGISRIGFYTGGHKARFRDEDLADEWVRRSNAWIESHKDRPFFLFFASHDNHVPRIPHERFQGATPHGFRADSIVQFDWCVGEIMKTLDRLQLSERTLVIVCSDNGPVLDDGYKDQAVEKLGDHQPAGPFSGGKYSVLEGGTRTPFIVHWRGRVPAGVSDEIVCTLDFPASLAALAGVALPDDACLDSQNILPALLGEPGAKGRGHLIQQDNGMSGNFGFRVGEWKLVRQKKALQTSAVVTTGKRPRQAKLHSLYHLPSDPGETSDLSESQPEKTRELIEMLDAQIAAGRTR